MSLPLSLIKEDSLWKPAVYVPKDCVGFLIHPGSTITPSILPSGWQFHWPLLSVLRVLHFQTVEYLMTQVHNRPQFGDDPIVAVSQDHQLFTVTGSIMICLDKHSSIEQMQKVNRHTTNRLIRPIVRQAIREMLAETQSSALAQKQSLAPDLLWHIKQLLAPHGMVADSIKNLDIALYYNLLES